ncbi:MAG TPA: HD domain-containing protein [Chloroflexota bacterium]|nr:HD domain-containing protein [Chloroflexota bacterium]
MTTEDRVTDGAPIVAEGDHVSPQEATPERAIFHVPARHNPRLQELVARIDAMTELHQLWRCANVNAVDRAGISDHGPTHVQIVANISLKLLRLLMMGGVEPSIVRDYGLTPQDAEVVVVLGAALHDIGMSIHRHEHETYSLILGAPIARRLLAGLYEEPLLTIMTSETLHAVIAHRSDERTYTIEASSVKVGDALDMTQGRSRIPFEAGAVNIHSLSAAAVERVIIERGETVPINIEVILNNSAGLFQLDELLRPKIASSSIAPYVQVEARIEGEIEKRLLPVYNI